TGKPRRDGQFRCDPSGWPEAACVDAKNGWRRGGGSAGGVAANVPRQWPGATASSLISRQHPPHSRYEGCWPFTKKRGRPVVIGRSLSSRSPNTEGHYWTWFFGAVTVAAARLPRASAQRLLREPLALG